MQLADLAGVAAENFTDAQWWADKADPIIGAAIQILLILLAAVLLRWLLHRLIRRLTATNGSGMPALIRPMREKAPSAADAMNTQERERVVAERRRQRAQTLASVLRSITSFVIYGIAFLLVVGELGFDLAPLLASAGVLGVAIAFGAQNLVSDFLSGMFMMVEDQYGVGDWIDVGEAAGTVEAVGLRVTTLRDTNGTVWYVRNGEIVRVGNSSQGYAVAIVDLPLAHSTDVARASEIAQEVASRAARTDELAADVLEAPEVWGVNQITADTVTLRLAAKTRPGKQWAVQRALREQIKAAYNAEGIRPPYPSGRPLIGDGIDGSA